MKLLLMAMLLISSATNQQETPVGQKAHLDQEFKIKIGQESLVDKLKVKFEAVPRDGCCPCGDQCGSFDYAAVLLRVASPERKDKYVVLNTDSKAKEVLARGYKISLICLDPCPEETGNIKRDEYEATLLVTKSQTATGSSYQGSNARQPDERKPNFSGTWSFEGADTVPWAPGGNLSGRSIWFHTGLLASLNSIAHRGRKLEISVEHFVRGRVSKDFYYKTIYYIDGRPRTTTKTFHRVTTVLLTDEPVRKEFLLLSFERGLIGDGYGLRLRFDESGNVLESLITHPHGQSSMFDATPPKEFKIENGRVVGAVEYKERGAKENDADRDGYSVSFDAPLKK